jgi:hypothetical protein
MSNQIISLFFIEDYETLKVKIKNIIGRDLFPNEFAYIINPDTTTFNDKSFFLTNEKGSQKALQSLKQKISSMISENGLTFNLYSMNYETPRVPQRRIIIGQPIQQLTPVIHPKRIIPTIKYRLNFK